jgi:hypothetical protein
MEPEPDELTLDLKVAVAIAHARAHPEQMRPYVPRSAQPDNSDARMKVLDDINALLDAQESPIVSGPVALPVSLRNAAVIAVARLGAAPSVTALITDALRRTLEEAVSRAALDSHYAQHPHARPSLGEVALAYAEQTGSPLAQRPELLDAAAQQIVSVHPDADGRDVLMWAQGWLSAQEESAQLFVPQTAAQVQAHKRAELDRYLDWLEKEQGLPTPEQLAAADRWVNGLLTAIRSADRAVVDDMSQRRWRARARREAREMAQDPADRGEVAATMRFLDGDE